jgi:hypothetical protein
MSNPSPKGMLGEDLLEGNGTGRPARQRTPRLRATEPGRPRNYVIPDSLHDQLALYARRTKVKVTGKHGREHTRSLNISEAAVRAFQGFLGSKRLAIVEQDKLSADD